MEIQLLAYVTSNDHAINRLPAELNSTLRNLLRFTSARPPGDISPSAFREDT
jgi:hypothetical protein